MEERATCSYDLTQFNAPIYAFENLQAIEVPLKDGIYHSTEPLSLDVYTSLFEEAHTIGTIIVCFNAAVDQRSSKCGPFFSGRNLAESLKLPLISVADPLVSSTNLSIAWYGGSENHLNFQQQIASFLDRVAEHYKARLIIFGGSGGGFASLAISHFLKSEATLVVFNPQTSISKYSYEFAHDYVTTAFPSHFSVLASQEPESVASKAAKLHETLQQTNIVHDVTEINFPDNIKLLYLQNKTDWHVDGHAIPFIRDKKWSLLGQNSLIFKDLGMYFGSWGKGHIAPNADIIATVLRKAAELRSIRAILTDLENGLNGLNPNAGSITFLNSTQYKLAPYFHIGEKLVLAGCSVKRKGIPFQDRELSFAFYLMDGPKRISTRYYSKDPYCEFELPGTHQNISTRCFVRDKFGQVLSTYGIEVSHDQFVNSQKLIAANKNPKPAPKNKKPLKQFLKFIHKMFFRR
ncbi:hypothetical protein W822_04215 [Advenella kashmirensis W13003]|uniref:Uncharacterized protein n=1 Tax=Advenella kashmirensis W13003 TaxID=1424334 RepID=V8QXT8_9BURK|nr:hypothetical protein [Advenella kashmirensis]ETF04726.1 hypothetical protein W822_04215 [Advenella kashmirensis W13003]